MSPGGPGVRRLVALAAIVAVALVATVGVAAAGKPLRVCATCAYTDIPAALAAAAARSGDDTIQIAAGSYPAPIAISTNVTLRGAGAGQTTIGRVDVDAGVLVTITGVTITNVRLTESDLVSNIRNEGTLTVRNSAVSDNLIVFGCPGIENLGTLTLQNSTVSGNDVPFGAGGGICNESMGTATLRNSTVSGNRAPGSGGIWNQGALALHESTVTDNSSFLGNGGGIFNGGTGTVTIKGSAVTSNRAEFPGSSGGGVYNDGTMIVQASIVDGNEAGIRGGGIFNAATGNATLRDSAVRNNRVTTVQSSPVPSGGGIYNMGALSLLGCTVTGNTAPNYPGLQNDGGTLTIKDSTVQP
jgi:hypothetical protein